MVTLAMLVRYLSNIASILAQSVAGGVGEEISDSPDPGSPEPGSPDPGSPDPGSSPDVAGGRGAAVVGGEDDKFSLFPVVWCGAVAGGSPVNPIGCGGGGIRPPYHINVVPRKMLKEKVANFL